MFHMDAGVAILGIFPGFDIVRRVSIAESLRKNLVKYRVLHPGRLHIVRQQDKIIAVLRKVGGDLLLGIEIDHILADNVKMILHPLFNHLQGALPIDKAIYFLRPVHIHLQLSAIGRGAKDHMLHRGIGIHPQANGDGFMKLWSRIGHKGGRAVGIDTFKPGFHRWSPLVFFYCTKFLFLSQDAI